jgi:GNAT superfamily N-acetyltransferase
MVAEAKLVEVTRTYLEINARTELNASYSDDPNIRIERIENCPASFFRYLYCEVGRNYHWVDRLGWKDDQIADYLSRPNVLLWLLSYRGAPAGYCELLSHSDASVELTYFGLLSEFMGKGLGKHLLSSAVEEAFALGANRVWLQTCTLDDPAAMPNYLKRGFKPFKTEKYLTAM